jgi:GNAT superfamily N-acetyltransferase
MGICIRQAIAADIPVLRELIAASVRGLQAQDYTAVQLESALKTVYGVDSQLIADGTYFAAEAEHAIVGCGGWSKRKTLYGGDQWSGREDLLLDPCKDAAKIRAFFIHPDWARRGIGSLILEVCENAARGSAGGWRIAADCSYGEAGVRALYRTVILSGVSAARSAADTESKDPGNACAKMNRERNSHDAPDCRENS